MKKHFVTFLLVFLSLCTYFLLRIAPYFPNFIERYFSRGINHYMTLWISQLTGLLPFSLAEIGLYGLILYFILHILYRLYASIKAPKTWAHQLLHWFLQTLNIAAVLWLIFAWSWDFNYYRIPLETTLGLDQYENHSEDLTQLYRFLIEDLNTLRPQVSETPDGYMTIEDDFDSLYLRANEVYQKLSQDYPIFKGSYGHPKSILASPLMNYTGLTGIYAPFTREANINTAILPQTIPSTTLHEMAHQRGFAEEEYCNFIAYLASTYAQDADFRYSGDLLALAYTSQALAKTNYDALITLNQTIDPAVMKDIQQNNDFWQSYQGTVEKASTSLNNSYLKANGVSDGVESYGRMVDLLLAYYISVIQPS